MKGEYHIVVQNKNLKYEFDIKRNITIIKGDSATGKTTLIELIREYGQEGEESGIQLSWKAECVVVEGQKWKDQLSAVKDSIVFIDETNKFIETQEFASAVKESTNYFVIITRESLEMLLLISSFLAISNENTRQSRPLCAIWSTICNARVVLPSEEIAPIM